MPKNGITTIVKGELGELRTSIFSSRRDLKFKCSETLSFKYVIEGEENYSIEGKHYKLVQNQALFFKDLQAYDGFIAYQGVTKGLCVDLNTRLLEYSRHNLLQDDESYLFDQSFRAIKMDRTGDRLQFLKRVVDEESHEGCLFQEEIMMELMQALIGIDRKYCDEIEKLPLLKTANRKEIYKRLRIARNFIHDHYTENLSLDQLASNACLSTFYFQRLFKKAFGLSPAAYHEHLKLEKAVELLGSRSNTEISEDLGFTDLAHFSNRFKKFYGVSPSAFKPDDRE